MKIIDAQSAVLTNSEVVSFMRAHPPRRPDPQVGGYPVTDLRGLWSARRDFSDYTEIMTPHLLAYPEPPSKYMQTLLRRLDRFKLTKPEMLMIINLGVGVKKAIGSRQRAIDIPDEAEGQSQGVVEEGDGDLLDKVERHINSSEGLDVATLNGNGQHSIEDVDMQDEQNGSSDITILNTIVEEMYERFDEADIDEILQTCGIVLDGSSSTDYSIEQEMQGR